MLPYRGLVEAPQLSIHVFACADECTRLSPQAGPQPSMYANHAMRLFTWAWAVCWMESARRTAEQVAVFCQLARQGLNPRLACGVEGGWDCT